MNATRQRPASNDRPAKTLIKVRPWLEAKRRPGDGQWALWYRADRMTTEPPHRQHVEGYAEETYTGWVQINVARNVKTLLDTAPAGYL